MLYKHIITNTGADFYTPFSIRSSDSRCSCWLPHLSKIGRARDATTITAVAVATVGLWMLTGRLNIRRGVTVIPGSFILFGAASIASGLRSAAIALPGAPGKSARPRTVRGSDRSGASGPRRGAGPGRSLRRRPSNVDPVSAVL